MVEVGQNVIALDWVNLRSGPGLNYDMLLTFAPTDEPLPVRGGPVSADGLRWWNMERLGQSVWAAEQANGVRLLVSNSPFEIAMRFVLRIEGGFQADPNDRGNYTPAGELRGTKYGISANSYPGIDIKNLTETEAKAIYFNDYWKRSHADKWPLEMACCIMDCAVNAGLDRAWRLLPESGGNWREYNNARRRWYATLNQFDLYGKVWMRRVDELDEYLS